MARLRHSRWAGRAALALLAPALVAGAAHAAPASLTIDFETRPDGLRPTTPGERLYSYPSLGVRLRSTLEVVACGRDPVARGGSNCERARSGSRAVRPLLAGEFRRNVLDISFAGEQDEVTIHVRADRPAASDGQPTAVVMSGYDRLGNFVGNTTVRFVHDFDDGRWHELRLERGERPAGVCPRLESCPTRVVRISRVEIWGGAFAPSEVPEQARADNFLLFDDLVLDGQIRPLPRADALMVELIQPEDGVTVSSAVVDVRFRVRQWGGLDGIADIDLEVSPSSSGGLLTVCGRDGFPECRELYEVFGEIIRVVRVELTVGAGPYTIRVHACNTRGSCRSDATSIVFAPPEALPRAFAIGVEINQSVQTLDGIFPVDGPGTIRVATGPSVPVLRGKDTVVRYYVGTTGAAPISGISARLDFRVWRPGDAFPTFSRTLSPNTDAGTTTTAQPVAGPAAWPAALRSMRPDEAATLNFVIPGDLLEEAELLDLTLRGYTGVLQVPLAPAPTLGVYNIALYVDGKPEPTLAELEDLHAGLAALYPIAEVRFPDFGEDRWDPSPALIPPFNYVSRIVRYTGTRRTARRVLHWLETAYGGDRLPGDDRPEHVVLHGLISTFDPWLDDAGGIGERPGDTALSQTDLRIASQELAHTIGLTHAGDDHGESEGGRTEPWPYAHGLISPDGVGVFGVAARRIDGAGGGTGSWNLWLGDPCPGASAADRLAGCGSLADEVTHDFMSYGTGMPGSEWIFGPSRIAWPSDITYGRIYSKLTTGAIVPPIGSLRAFAAEEAQVEALIVSGEIREDGATDLTLPLLRKPLPGHFLAVKQGPFLLELRDGAGNVLLQRPFGVEQLGHHDRTGAFWLAVPYDPAAQRLLVRFGQYVLLDRSAGPNAPRVRVLSPNGGEVFRSGKVTVTWEGEDADGDALAYLVQYSPDGGRSWQGITLVESGANEAEIPVSQLIPGTNAVVRVTASDGFNTAVDYSDAVFGLGRPN